MAVLSDADRAKITTGLQRLPVDVFGSAPNVLKADLRAAVNAMDNWIDGNAAAINAALPTAFRTNASQAQKTMLFCVVALVRVSLDFAKRILEVD